MCACALHFMSEKHNLLIIKGRYNKLGLQSPYYTQLDNTVFDFVLFFNMVVCYCLTTFAGLWLKHYLYN